MEDMTVPGFSWDEGKQLHQRMRVGGEDRWVACLPWNVIPTGVLREGDEIKVVDCDVIFVSGRVKHVSFPTSLTSASRPAQELERETGLDLTHKDAQNLVQFLATIAAELAHGIPETSVLTTAEWDGDELKVPGPMMVSPRRKFAELAKYGGTKGDEDEAKKAWRGVLQIAARPENAKLLIALGMPIGSLYAARLRRPPYNQSTATFALHLTGDSARGKTQLAIAAMSTLGDVTEKSSEANLYRTWNMSAQAPIALAHQLGIMPMYFDEAATSDKEPEAFTQQLFDLAQGTERQRATVTGDVDEVDRWECCVLSTGEMRLSSKSGLMGIRRRVQELYAPFTAQHFSDEVFKLATSYYGWPLHWIAANPDPGMAAQYLDTVRHEIDDPISWLNAAATNLSVCGLGLLMLARVIDAEDVLTAPVVNRAVQTVVEKTARGAVEEGVDVGIKLAKAVWDAVAQRPNNFPPVEAPVALSREREGFLLDDDTVAVISKAALMRIARDAGLPDFQAGVRMLNAQDLMVSEPGRDQTYVTFMRSDTKKDRKRMYVFKPLKARDQ